MGQKQKQIEKNQHQASFSQERMTYVPEAGSVIYQSKDGRNTRVFDALEWSRQKAAGCKHSPP